LLPGLLMPELQLALELLAAFIGGLFCMAFITRLLSSRNLGTGFLMPSTVVLYDQDGHAVHAASAEAGHWLQKGYARKWVSNEQVPGV